MAVISGIVGFLVLYIATNWYFSHARKEVLLYAGLPGSSSWRTSDDLKQSFEKAMPSPGVHYSVKSEYIDGFEEIHRRVAQDTSGLAVGFTVDASLDSSKPAILLPLDWDYLHLVVSREFIESLTKRPVLEGKKERPLLERILGGDELKNRRVYAGPLNSATRRYAEQVVTYYHKEVEMLSCPDITDFQEAEAAMKRHDIDLMFYSGPIGSKIIKNLKKETILVSLEPIHQAMSQQNNYAVWPTFIPANSYSALQEKGMAFCPEPVGTIAYRRLLICSPKMSARDAFLLARAARQAFDDTPWDNWDAKPPSVTADIGRSHVFGLPIHPGAESLRLNRPIFDWYDPRGWPTWLAALLGSIFLTLVIQLLPARAAATSPAPRTDPLPPPAPVSVTPPVENRAAGHRRFAEIQSALNNLLEEMQKRELPWSEVYKREKFAAWQELKSQVRQCAREEQVSKQEIELMFASLRHVFTELQAAEKGAKQKPASPKKKSVH